MSYLNEYLNDLATNLENNFSNLNSGGCGVVAYYVAKYFKLKEILAIQGIFTRTEDFLKNILDKRPSMAVHYYVKTGKDTLFDADGVMRLNDIRYNRMENNFKLVRESDITVSFIHDEIYNKTPRFFHVLLEDHLPLHEAIKNKWIWNDDFDRKQIPHIKKLIKCKAKNFNEEKIFNSKLYF